MQYWRAALTKPTSQFLPVVAAGCLLWVKRYNRRKSPHRLIELLCWCGPIERPYLNRHNEQSRIEKPPFNPIPGLERQQGVKSRWREGVRDSYPAFPSFSVGHTSVRQGLPRCRGNLALGTFD